jgi:hypothetical protein
MRIDNKNGSIDFKLWRNDDEEYIFRIVVQKGNISESIDIRKEEAIECVSIIDKAYGSYENGQFKFAFAADPSRFGFVINKIGSPIEVSDAKYLKIYIEESLRLIAQDEIQKDLSEYNPFSA